jgi:hypothetical protein
LFIQDKDYKLISLINNNKKDFRKKMWFIILKVFSQRIRGWSFLRAKKKSTKIYKYIFSHSKKTRPSQHIISRRESSKIILFFFKKNPMSKKIGITDDSPDQTETHQRKREPCIKSCKLPTAPKGKKSKKAKVPSAHADKKIKESEPHCIQRMDPAPHSDPPKADHRQPLVSCCATSSRSLDGVVVDHLAQQVIEDHYETDSSEFESSSSPPLEVFYCNICEREMRWINLVMAVTSGGEILPMCNSCMKWYNKKEISLCGYFTVGKWVSLNK